MYVLNIANIAGPFFFFIMGLIIGDWFFLRLNKWRDDITAQKERAEDVIVFDRSVDLIDSNKISFMSRYNHQVVLRFHSKTKSKQDLYFFMDKKEVALFVDGVCKHTFQYVDESKVKGLCDKLDQKFKTEIEDSVKIFNGVIVDRKTFDRINIGFGGGLEALPLEDDAPISEENDNVFVLDDVLDRITQVGYDNLSNEEKEFLKSIK